MKSHVSAGQRVSLYVKQVTLSIGKCQAMCAERNNVLSSNFTSHQKEILKLKLQFSVLSQLTMQTVLETAKMLREECISTFFCLSLSWSPTRLILTH